MINNFDIFKNFSDNSIKYVFNLENNYIIEMNILNIDDIDIVYVPTHYYCNQGCKICNLTNNNINNSTIEIKIDNFIECLIKTLTKRNNNKKLLISFIGIGEPLLNIKLIEELYKKEDILKQKLNYENIGYELSTTMPNKNILELTELVNKLNIPLKINFSMYTPIDSKRFNLIPSTKITIEESLAYLINYRSTLQSNSEIMNKYMKVFKNNNPIEIYYTLIKDINDSQEELTKVCELLSIYNISIKLIKFNSINELKNSENEQIWIDKISKEFANIDIKSISLPTITSKEFTNHYYYPMIETDEDKIKFDKWKNEHQMLELQRQDVLNWDEYFMAIAKLSAMRSKDPNTQVGACIVSKDNRILSTGYNGAPNGYLDECFPWNRDGDELNSKYIYVIHAERNAILNYRGSRKEFEDGKIYVDLFPCNECAKEIIQAGIKEVIYLSDKYANTPSTIASKRLFDICKVHYRQLNKENQKVLKLSLTEK